MPAAICEKMVIDKNGIDVAVAMHDVDVRDVESFVWTPTTDAVL